MADFPSAVPPLIAPEIAPFDLADADPARIKALVGRYFDADFYRRKYRQDDADPDALLEAFCRRAGDGLRDPNEWFSTRHYVWVHADVRACGVLPFLHYLVHGHREHRWICPATLDQADDIDPDDPDDIRRDMLVVREQFDEAFYRARYADLTDPNASALEDFCTTGWRNGRDPNGWFSTTRYLERYPDVVTSGRNPFVHYLLYGVAEQRVAVAADGSAAADGATAARLPADFRPLDYRRANGDLADLTEDWQLVEHYLAHGQQENRAFQREFDARFYQRLYFPAEPWRTERELRAHFDQGGRTLYANANEALHAAGFRSCDWLSLFNVQSYIVSNSLCEEILTDAQAIVHFIFEGVESLAPMSERLWFDPAFYRQMVAEPDAVLSDTDCYRAWLERGLPNGVPPNGAEFLKGIGLDIPALPEGFDHAGYASRHPALLADRGRPYAIFAHYVRVGVNDAFLPFKDPSAAALLLRHIGDHHAVQGRLSDANALYERALILDGSDPRLIQHVADLALRERNFPRALRYYRQIRERGAGSYWTWLNGGTAAFEAGMYEEAVQWGNLGLTRHPRTEAFVELCRRGFERQLEGAITDHIAACRDGDAGGGAFQAAVARIFDAMLVSERLRYGGGAAWPGVAVASGQTLRVIMLANQDIPQCTRYRVRQKAEQAARQGLAFRVFSREDPAGFIDACADADVAIFYRLAADIGTLQCLATCRRLAIPSFFEIDDLVFSAADFPDAIDSYGGALDAEQHFGLVCGTALVRAFAALCDFGIASTGALAAAMTPVVRQHQVFVHRNGLSAFLERVASGTVGHGLSRDREEIVIFYGSGTLAHAADCRDVLFPAIERVMRTHREVRFCACGHVDVAWLRERFPGRVEAWPVIADYQAYIGLLSRCDINVAVLRNCLFNDCKSEIKWIEAAACGVPTVASDVGAMREALVDGQNVLLASWTVDDWVAKLEALVGSRERRADIARAAAVRALDRYAPAGMGQALEAGLRTCLAARSPAPRSAAARSRRRVLLVNVFASPQSIGGATRIFDAQVEILASRHTAAFEVAVCCGNNEAAEPYRLETYRLANGVRVFSINTPQRAHMDWLPIDEDVRAPFERVVDSFRPDLIHFHCIQRLTGVVGQIACERNIPFIVTLHDAWWICDYQFLMDANDRRIHPQRWQADDEAGPVSRRDSVARQISLAVILRQAASAVAVSDSFAALYRACGIEGVVTIENGIQVPPPLPPRARVSDKIVLGHLGGMSYHKGYFLFRRAVIEARQANFAILVVDHSLREGETRTECWGLNLVTFIAKVPQGRIAELYAQLDVLVAPSIWPESFGLVTREAASYRKWIIASDRGAIGQPVVSGRNGFVVDVRTTAGLVDALRTISGAPEIYRESTEVAVETRSMAQNVSDYADLYRRIEAKPRPVRRSGAQA